jgi:hypothetical protein
VALKIFAPIVPVRIKEPVIVTDPVIFTAALTVKLTVPELNVNAELPPRAPPLLN